MNMERIRNLLDGGLKDWSLNGSEVTGWIRLGAPFLLWIASLRRSFRQLFSIFAFVVVSPYVFSQSGEDRRMNRAMRGEQEWILRGRFDASTGIVIASVVFLKLAVLTGLFRKFWVSLFWLMGSSILTVWHYDRMATSFENERSFEDVQVSRDDEEGDISFEELEQ